MQNLYRIGYCLLETEWPNPLENPLAERSRAIQPEKQAQTWILATDYGTGNDGLCNREDRVLFCWSGPTESSSRISAGFREIG